MNRQPCRHCLFPPKGFFLTNEAVLRISDNKGRHVWPFRVFRYLKSEKDIVKQEKGYPKTGNLFIFLKNFNSFCPRTSQDRGVFSPDFCSYTCPGTKGHWDKKFFCPGTKGQRNVLSRFVSGRPVPWKRLSRPVEITELFSDWMKR